LVVVRLRFAAGKWRVEDASTKAVVGLAKLWGKMPGDKMITRFPEKLEAKDAEILRVAPFQFLKSLLHFRSGRDWGVRRQSHA
jgi:hypothetical protein